MKYISEMTHEDACEYFGTKYQEAFNRIKLAEVKWVAAYSGDFASPSELIDNQWVQDLRLMSDMILYRYYHDHCSHCAKKYRSDQLSDGICESCWKEIDYYASTNR